MALAPVNWPLELIKIFGPASLALAAAYFGFKLANAGRKYDLLYKERYKSTEETIGYLHNMERKLELLFLAVVSFTFDNPETKEEVFQKWASQEYLYDSFKHKYLVILVEADQVSFHQLDKARQRLLSWIRIMDINSLVPLKTLSQSESTLFTANIELLNKYYQDYSGLSQNLVTSLYNNLDLPRK